jgi:hypothetical protein
MRFHVPHSHKPDSRTVKANTRHHLAAELKTRIDLVLQYYTRLGGKYKYLGYSGKWRYVALKNVEIKAAIPPNTNVVEKRPEEVTIHVIVRFVILSKKKARIWYMTP